MKRFMRKPQEGRKMLFGKMNKRDDRGSAIVIVIIAMALIGILATTILWASYLNYRIKVNDLKVKNSFYSAETVIEQITAGVKKNVVSASVNEAYQEVVSNWDALGTDDNRESYFITAYIAAVEEKLGVGTSGAKYIYNKNIIKKYVDANLWEGAAGNVPTRDGYIVNQPWDEADPEFKPPSAANHYGSMSIKNICVEFYDSDGLLSIINTDIAIDVPKLRFTQAGTIDRLYPYVLVGDDGIVTKGNTIGIKGSIYGGVDDDNKGGIQIARDSHVTVEDAAYIISAGDIVVGNDSNFVSLINQNAELIVRDVSSGGVGYRTNVYAQGLALNGSHMDISGRVFVANDLILSGRGSNVSLAGQYFGYGKETGKTRLADEPDDEGNTPYVNPAASSSAIVINGKDSAVDLTGLNTLQLAGRAYVSLGDADSAGDQSGLPHVLMGESISVKSNQIAYLVPAECVGTLNGKTLIGQNPVSFETWSKMLASIPEYADPDNEQFFRLVDNDYKAVKLGGQRLISFGVGSITAEELSGKVNLDDPASTITNLNNIAKDRNIRFLYMPEKQQVYLYLVMDAGKAAEYFTAYYNVNSNKASLDSYFNQYVSGGIKLKENVQGYTVVGNSMVSITDSADRIQTSPEDGSNLVQLLSSVTAAAGDDEDGDEEGEAEPVDPDAYTEVSDNITKVDSAKSDDELTDLINNADKTYKNLILNLLETDAGTEMTVFENLIRLETPEGSESTMGLQEYLDNYALSGGKVEFKSGSGKKAVLVDCKKQSGDTFVVSDSDLRLVVAIGDVEVKRNFKGLIIASGTITVADSVTCEQDGEGVYEVLQAQSEIEDDTNVPANVFYNGPGMIKSGYEDADVDEHGNLNINYSEIVRYENWIKK